MPFNGAGIYSAPASSWNPAVNNTDIDATDWATLLADITTALSTAMLKDGTAVPTANLPMAGFKLTGLGAGSGAGNSLRYEQLFTSGAVAFVGGISLTGGTTLSAYIEAAWTPADGSGASLTLTVNTPSTSVKIGQMVFAEFDITYPVTANGSAALISGLPYAGKATDNGWGVLISFQNVGAGTVGRTVANSSTFNFADGSGNPLTNASLSGKTLRGVVIYRAAA